MPPLQLRRNTSTYWQQANPTPASGEPVAFTDSGQLAVGDGTTPLISLPRMLTDKLAAALYVGRSLLGLPGGVATLGADGKVPDAQSKVTVAFFTDEAAMDAAGAAGQLDNVTLVLVG